MYTLTYFNICTCELLIGGIQYIEPAHIQHLEMYMYKCTILIFINAIMTSIIIIKYYKHACVNNNLCLSINLITLC